MTRKNESSEQVLHRLFGIDADRLSQVIGIALDGKSNQGGMFCEIYLEHKKTEAYTWDQGRKRHSGSSTVKGAGVRVVIGDKVGYAHTDRVNFSRLAAAAKKARKVAEFAKNAPPIAIDPEVKQHNLYELPHSLFSIDQARKLKLLQEVDAEARAFDARIKNVTVQLSMEEKTVIIANSMLPDLLTNERPMLLLYVNCTAEDNGRIETGSQGGGGRQEFDTLYADGFWKKLTKMAATQAVNNLSAIPAPAGEMTVVLGPGLPGVLLHEAVGHPLEGDFNRKGTSAFNGMLGQKVAADCVTVIDDGKIPGRRGSLDVDDEGQPTGHTVLIENGILKGFMQDRQNANLMGVAPTGNGRRESYRHAPMPRMTNTYMAGGKYTHEEIIKSVKYGMYAEVFGGGQVDITSGNFTFSATGAWLIEDGELTKPLKGATLIGNGPKALHHVSMVGNDSALDLGIGTCGKNGQSVPVGVGMGTVKIDRMTVGGTGN